MSRLIVHLKIYFNLPGSESKYPNGSFIQRKLIHEFSSVQRLQPINQALSGGQGFFHR
jgi:hypothetical protein